MHYVESIARKPVQSSAVRSVGYDAHDWVLQVKYTNGQVYNYFRVPPIEHQCLLAAASKGAYMNLEIKPYYEYEQVDVEASGA